MSSALGLELTVVVSLMLVVLLLIRLLRHNSGLVHLSQHKLNQVAHGVFEVPFLSYLTRIAVCLTSG